MAGVFVLTQHALLLLSCSLRWRKEKKKQPLVWRRLDGYMEEEGCVFVLCKEIFSLRLFGPIVPLLMKIHWNRLVMWSKVYLRLVPRWDVYSTEDHFTLEEEALDKSGWRSPVESNSPHLFTSSYLLSLFLTAWSITTAAPERALHSGHQKALVFNS